jgi:hypothetical protein
MSKFSLVVEAILILSGRSELTAKEMFGFINGFLRTRFVRHQSVYRDEGAIETFEAPTMCQVKGVREATLCKSPVRLWHVAEHSMFCSSSP